MISWVMRNESRKEGERKLSRFEECGYWSCCVSFFLPQINIGVDGRKAYVEEEWERGI